MGRLGNQMFQFASTLGISDRTSLEARFPIENCFRLQASGPFDPKSGTNMQVKCDLLDCFEINPSYFIPERHLELSKIYSEAIFGYDAGTESITDGTSLYGYYQTEKYFSHIREKILKEFSFKQHIKDFAGIYMENIRKSNKDSQIVSIHVRRGDYVMFPDHHPTCTKDYYSKSIEEFEIESTIFLVFSDDVEWCRNEFTDPNYIICDLQDPYVELCLMSLCDHHIIANSSYSWWGSWLNINPNKKVIAPSRWFGTAINKDVSDIYCKDWKII